MDSTTMLWWLGHFNTNTQFIPGILFFSFNAQSGFDLLAVEAITHSKFSFPIPIQLASAYDRVKAINSTQKSILKVSHKETKETDLTWQCSNQSTKLFHITKTDVVNHIDDTATLNKVYSGTTQTYVTNFETLMLAKVVIDYDNHGTTEWLLHRNKSKWNSQVIPWLVHTNVNETKKLANTIKAKKNEIAREQTKVPNCGRP